MANLDKLRERAQYPDCIFSAFPDSSTGEMYHPRRASTERIAIEASKAELDTPIIVDGEFRSAAGHYRSGFTGVVTDSVKNSRKFTLICKFKASRPDDGKVSYIDALQLSGGAGSHYTGLGWQMGTMSASRPNMVILPRMATTDADGKVNSFAGTSITFPWDEWHTIACTIDMDNCEIASYKDGVKLGTAQKTWECASFYPVPGNQSFCKMQTTANTATINNKPISARYGLIFDRILSDEEILYLMKE